MTASSNAKPKASERVITYDFLNRKPCIVCAHPTPRILNGEHLHRLCDDYERVRIEADRRAQQMFLEQGTKKKRGSRLE